MPVPLRTGIFGRRTEQAKANLDPRVAPQVGPRVGPRVDPRDCPRERPREHPRQDPQGLTSLFSAPQRLPRKLHETCHEGVHGSPTKVSSQVVKVHLSCFHLFCLLANFSGRHSFLNRILLPKELISISESDLWKCLQKAPHYRYRFSP